MATPATQQQVESPRLQKVMVAVDESESSRYALEWALRNMAPTLAPPLLLLTVQPLVPVGYVSVASFGAPRPAAAAHAGASRHGQGHLRRPRGIIQVAVETFVEVGDAKEVVCEIADKKKVHLLILGSHGRGPIERSLDHRSSVRRHRSHSIRCTTDGGTTRQKRWRRAIFERDEFLYLLQYFIKFDMPVNRLLKSFNV